MNSTTSEMVDMVDMADEFVFDNEVDPAEAIEATAWKVLIADDEPDVHIATKLVLKDFSFKDRGIEFLDAYSGAEACDILRRHPDTAVVFLDVVMETEHAGLEAVKRIRDELDNQMVRIILRTGQPGIAPEDSVVLNYHINDYKSKSEMTTQKMFTSIVSALRSFQDLQTIESSRRGLAKILDAASTMDFRSRNLFISGLLQQLGSLLDIGDNDLIDLILIRQADDFRIMAACGSFEPFVGESIEYALDAESSALVEQVLSSRNAHTDGKRSIYPVSLPNAGDVAIYIGGARTISEAELALMIVFCEKIVLACDNYEFVEQSRNDQNAELALLAKLTVNADYLSIPYLVNRGRLCRDIVLQMQQNGVAEKIGDRLAETIERAAMLADLGNCRIPAAILEKAGALSADESMAVRRHPQAGADLLDEILAEVGGGRAIGLAREIALTHHEGYDGGGYPQQLAAKDIPLSGRVVAVADGYMALTSKRPWRGAFAHTEAIAMIQSESGGKYDPDVVAAFLSVSDAYREA